MKEKLMKQTTLILLFLLALLVADHSHVHVLEHGASVIRAQMTAEYTWDDVKRTGRHVTAAAAGFPEKVSETVKLVTGRPMLAEPIDQTRHGKHSSVYAVESGMVVGTGEDETIGKYIRISHGKKGESLYGNLEKILVKTPVKVKRGQIIGTYDNSCKKAFYYSFNVED